MSGIQLQKRAEAVGIVLAKRGVTKVPPVRVGVALDVSGSARNFYTPGGVMQQTLDRLLGVALKFDDNGEIDAWTFDNEVSTLPTFSAEDEGKYVQEHIINNHSLSLWGGTSYAPPLRASMDFYFGNNPIQQAAESAKGWLGSLFGKKPAAAPAPAATSSKKDPAMLLFVTDGENSDKDATRQVLRDAASSSPMYFQMIGVGPAHYFDFISEMADELPNVGFVNLSSLSMTDEQLYEQLVSQEFCDWIKKL